MTTCVVFFHFPTSFEIQSQSVLTTERTLLSKELMSMNN